MAKNLQAKTRNLSKGEKPYEVWEGRGWRWEVLKKWQADDSKDYARWFCRVITPMTGERGELGDVYVADIKSVATLEEINGIGRADSVVVTPKEGDAFTTEFLAVVMRLHGHGDDLQRKFVVINRDLKTFTVDADQVIVLEEPEK